MLEKISLAVRKFKSERVIIGTIPISNITWEEAIQGVEELIREKSGKYILTPNVDHVVLAETDEYFRNIYLEAPMVLADGIPILWASRILGTPLKEKISGSDFLVRFSSIAAKKGYRIFFLGGKDDAAQISARILSKKFPGLNVVGICSPPLGFEKDSRTNNEVIDSINRASPDIVFVGLGTPKQEKWMYENKCFYQAGISFPVGAGFDFISGKSRRAPLWMQKIGLEWLWRLFWEPARLGKRYLGRDLKFFPILYKQMRNAR